MFENARALLLAVSALVLTGDGKFTWDTFEKYRDRINVKPTELLWQKVEWRDGFWNGLVEAQAKDKPILYWIYEGDPRGGC